VIRYEGQYEELKAHSLKKVKEGREKEKKNS
jgi:hypothetical protein